MITKNIITKVTNPAMVKFLKNISNTVLTGVELYESYILKVKIDPTFTGHPSWINDYVVPTHIVPCVRPSVECLSLATAYRAKMDKKIVAPFNRLEQILLKYSLSFLPTGIMVDGEKGERPVWKGILFDDKAMVDTEIPIVQLIDLLNYYTKETKLGDITTTFSKKQAEDNSVMYVDMTEERAANMSKSPSITKSREDMFVQFMDPANLGFAFHWYCHIMNKYFPDFCVVDGTVQDALDQLYSYVDPETEKEAIPVEARVKGVFPASGAIMVMKVANCEEAWSFLSTCRQMRGEDNKGISSVTMGYYYFSMGRSVSKDISLAKDILAFLDSCEMTQMMLNAPLRDYVVKILVFNGISVIIPDYLHLPVWTPAPGIYCTVEGAYAVYCDFNLKPPLVTNGVVNFNYIDLSNALESDTTKVTVEVKPKSILQIPIKPIPQAPNKPLSQAQVKGKKKNQKQKNSNSSSKNSASSSDSSHPPPPILPTIQTKVVYKLCHKFCYTYLTPKLKESKFGLFPSVMPHNGRVIVSKTFTKGYNFDLLLNRFAESNSYRNAYPYNRVPYCLIDKFREELNINIAMRLPKKSEAQVGDKPFEFFLAPKKVEAHVVRTNKIALFKLAPDEERPLVDNEIDFDEFANSIRAYDNGQSGPNPNKYFYDVCVRARTELVKLWEIYFDGETDPSDFLHGQGWTDQFAEVYRYVVANPNDHSYAALCQLQNPQPDPLTIAQPPVRTGTAVKVKANRDRDI